MKRILCLTLVVVGVLSLVPSADAGIFGRGRGLFRGAWGSRNVGGAACGSACGSSACNCGPACSPATCGPNGCSPAKVTSPPKKEVAAPLSPPS